MTGSTSFVDTNVVVYAHDRSAGPKHDAARALLNQLWESGAGCVSVQVLQELFVTLTRKVPRPLDHETARLVVADLAHWSVHSPRAGDVLAAIDLHRQHRISFWDAMIVRSAAALGCSVLYTEDLTHERSYDGVRTLDPFT